MTITRKKNGSTLEIAVKGKLDTTTAPDLAAEVDKGLDGAEFLLWDFSNLKYISSAGIRVLMIAANLPDDPDKMKITGCNQMVQMAFILTGLGEWLQDAF